MCGYFNVQIYTVCVYQFANFCLSVPDLNSIELNKKYENENEMSQNSIL